MKKVFSSFNLFVAVLLLVSCTSNSPKATADKFLNALYHYDYETAKSLSTEDTKKMLEMIEQFSDVMPDSLRQQAKKIKVDIKEVKEMGDTAVVAYEVSDEPAEKSIHLVKQQGKWLVQWSKMDAESGTEPEQVAPPADDTAQVPAVDGTEVDTTTKTTEETH